MNFGNDTMSQTFNTPNLMREPSTLRARGKRKGDYAQLPLPVETPSIRAGFDMATVAYSLMQLGSLLDNGSIAEYWNRGFDILRKQLAAKVVSFSLIEPIPGIDKKRIYLGESVTALQDAITSWEHLNYLAWKSADQVRKVEVDEISTVVGQFQIVHIHITYMQVIRGSVSLAFDWPQWHSAKEHEAIANIVQSFVSTGMRTADVKTLRSRLDQSTALFTGLHSLTSTLDLHSVLEGAIDLTTSSLNAEAATIFRSDSANNRLVFMVTRGSVANVLEERYIPTNEGVVGWVFEHGKERVFNDMTKCEMFNSSFDKSTGFNTRNIVCVPLFVLGEKIGVLEVLNKKDAGGFTSDDAQWLTVIANQVAVALKNAELYERKSREQDRLIKAQEDVRHQLARELHDNTAQMLTTITNRTELVRSLVEQGKQEKAVAELNRVEQIARQANREVRTLLYELRPIILESKGLIPALVSYHHQLVSTMGCSVHLQTDLMNVDMSLQDASGIFSIIQEAINNMRKYAHADNAWIRVRIADDMLVFEVEDDGVGFDIKDRLACYDSSGSFGLLNMRERASILGGELQIESPCVGRNNGTLVRGIVPMASLKARLQNKTQYWPDSAPQA